MDISSNKLARLYTRRPGHNSEKCRQYGERAETIDHLAIKFSKQAQKEYKNRHDWVGKVVYWELCKRLNFDHTTKWYMYKQESVQGIETPKIIRDFEIQMGHI